MCTNFRAKLTNLTFTAQNLPKNEFWGLNLGKLPDTGNIKVRIMLRVFQRAGWRLK